MYFFQTLLQAFQYHASRAIKSLLSNIFLYEDALLDTNANDRKPNVDIKSEYQNDKLTQPPLGHQPMNSVVLKRCRKRQAFPRSSSHWHKSEYHILKFNTDLCLNSEVLSRPITFKRAAQKGLVEETARSRDKPIDSQSNDIGISFSESLKSSHSNHPQLFSFSIGLTLTPINFAWLHASKSGVTSESNMRSPKAKLLTSDYSFLYEEPALPAGGDGSIYIQHYWVYYFEFTYTARPEHSERTVSHPTRQQAERLQIEPTALAGQTDQSLNLLYQRKRRSHKSNKSSSKSFSFHNIEPLPLKRISAGTVIQKRPGLTYRQAVLDRQSCPINPAQHNEDEAFADFEQGEELSSESALQHCYNYSCPAYGKDNDGETMERHQALQKPVCQYVSSKPGKTFGGDKRIGNMYLTRHLKDLTEMEVQKKVRAKFFDIRREYYPHTRYPPLYNAYKTVSEIQVGRKRTPHQTPLLKPKSPIGTLRKCLRTQVHKEQNTDFCTCAGNFSLRPCRCIKREPIPCTCVQEVSKCECAANEAKLKDKYHLYNNRKILRRSIQPTELRKPVDPCDIPKKKFNLKRQRYDRIDSKCPNALCSVCYRDPNIEWSFEVQDTYCKTQCVKDQPSEQDFSFDSADEEEGKGESSSNDLNCQTGKQQFDTVEQRQKKAKMYPYNQKDLSESERIQGMLKQAFDALNPKLVEEGEEEEEHSLEVPCLHEPRLIESEDSLPYECPLASKDPFKEEPSKKLSKACQLFKARQLGKQFAGTDPCRSNLKTKLSCWCRKPTTLTMPRTRCGCTCSWYCLPPKKIVDESLFPIFPNIENRRSLPRPHHRCPPFNPPM